MNERKQMHGMKGEIMDNEATVDEDGDHGMN